MRRLLLILLLVAAAAFASGFIAGPVEAATYPENVASYVARSNYGGACGRGSLAWCARRWPPRVTKCRLDGWCRFVDGYYQEWRNNASPIRPWKLWACRSNGYAHPRHGVAFTYKRCYKV